MSREQRPLWRRNRLRTKLLLALIAVSFVVFISTLRKRERVEWLVIEINRANGSVTMPPTIPELARQLLRGDFETADTTSVRLEDNALRDGWMRNHGNLADLKVANLDLRATRKFDAENFGLMADNPVAAVNAVLARNTDRIAEALTRSPTLRHFHVPGSDLTDDGLRLLPLEQLHSVAVQNSPVTARGLQELRRCERLAGLQIDGGQCDAELATTLKSLPALGELTLVGRKVRDEHLRLLSSLNVDVLRLDRTSVTSQGVQGFQATNPEVEVVELWTR